MNILICDDQKDYIDAVKKHIALFMQERHLEVRFTEAASGDEAIKEKTRYDIAFLDVEMAGLNGIDTARALRKINHNIIIFMITAHEKYLDDAMDLNILRFFRKPLNAERLYKGLEKAIELIDNTMLSFYLKSDDSLIQIPINSILFIEIENRKTKVVTKENTYYSKENMKYWRAHLIHSYFYAVHGSFIINMNNITNYARDEIVLDKIYRIPVAYRKQAAFRKVFLSFMENR